MNGDDGSEDFLKPMPKKHVVIKLRETLPKAVLPTLKRGLPPKDMNDKWIIVYRNNALYFYRSWTGYCIYIVHLKISKQVINLKHALVNRDRSQYSGVDNEDDRRLIMSLINSILD